MGSQTQTPSLVYSETIGTKIQCHFTFTALGEKPASGFASECPQITGTTASLASPPAENESISTTSNQQPSQSGIPPSIQISSSPLGGSSREDVTISTSGLPNGASSSNGVATASVPATKADKGLAGGAVAGIAIGMLLAGALIAAIGFCLLSRRQRRRNVLSAAAYSPHHASNATRNVGPEKGVTVTAVPRDTIEGLLPQPVEDGTITSDLSKIRDNIKNHVRTFYHSGPISPRDVNEPRIHDLAALTGTSAATIVSVLNNPTTRDHALRSIIGSVILTRCTGDRNPSLLPDGVAALLASTSTSANNGNHSQSILYSKWKVLTGVMLQQRHGGQNQDHSRTQAFEETIASLDSILAPFIKGSIDGGQRRKNLDMILTRAANFAFLLFTQPGTFCFDFAAPQGSLAVSPALLQTVGDQGQPLNPIKILTEKEVVAV